jgi:hypothetical protein
MRRGTPPPLFFCKDIIPGELFLGLYKDIKLKGLTDTRREGRYCLNTQILRELVSPRRSGSRARWWFCVNVIILNWLALSLRLRLQEHHFTRFKSAQNLLLRLWCARYDWRKSAPLKTKGAAPEEKSPGVPTRAAPTRYRDKAPGPAGKRRALGYKKPRSRADKPRIHRYRAHSED